jgi:hypothetical protein
MPPTNFKDEFAWSRAWFKHYRAIIAELAITEAPKEDDQSRATDMFSMTVKSGLRIAVRLRRPEAAGYAGQFTLTYRRESGAPCEWNKMILGGWADWFLYGHATTNDPAAGRIRPYYVIDLAKLRQSINKMPVHFEGRNKDATGKGCWFRAYRVSDAIGVTGSGLILASSTTQMSLGL